MCFAVLWLPLNWFCLAPLVTIAGMFGMVLMETRVVSVASVVSSFALASGDTEMCL